ncbi:MAG: tetratricopeptide repeat protein [Dysgonamonadaceae bacterium]|jgi:tetratricopeptide (TPR) repeat protein|nr:tetratricopeptide repeat protein [Dysgonamonadaceae bacterium]
MKKILSLLILLPVSILLPANESHETQRKFDYFFLEALRLEQKGAHTDAFNTLQYALKIDSTSAVALYEIHQYYLFLKKNDRALEALEKAVSYSGRNKEYRLALAALNGLMGRYEAAIALYEELVGGNPGEAELYYHLSNLYLQVQQTDKAIAALNSLEDNIGMEEAVSLQKYRLYRSMGKKDEALKEIEALADKFPTESKYRMIIGDFYLEEGEPDKALSYYEAVARTDPDNPLYFISMANYYEYRKQDGQAAQEIEKALKNPVLDSDTKLGILGKYIQHLTQTRKDIETANALFETLMEQHSQDKELNLMYGLFLLTQEKTDEARFQFQIVTEIEPENKAAWDQLLSIALEANRPEEVIALCTRALLYFPQAPEFYFYQGTAYAMRKEYPPAFAAFNEGLTFVAEGDRPLASHFLAQIADLYFQQGKKEDAYSCYEKALEYNEKNIVAMNNYAYYLSLEKEQLDKAERLSAAVMQLQPDNATYIDTYAWIFFRKGNYSLAKFYIESALSKTATPNSEMLEHYGDILSKTGNIDKAVSEWEKALVLKETEGEEKTETLRKKITDKTYYENQ